jgi:beta-lactamase regulating signal transducer with metallopeptidase domain
MNVTADALSSALVHSLWQDAIIGAVLWAALLALRHRTPNARYVACCAALALMALLPVLTTIALSTPQDSFAPASAPRTIVTPPEPSTFVAPVPFVAEEPPTGWLASLKSWTLPIWFAGVLLCSLRLVLASAHTVALRRRSVAEDGPIAATVAMIAARIGVAQCVSVRVSAMIGSPATFGIFRPIILLPPAALMGITPQQLEALIAHELAHVRRYDYLVNVLQMVAETLFFYHPIVWWTSRGIRVEREHCCDDIAVTACGDAVRYAEALTRMARLQLEAGGLAVGATGGAFLQRIQRLLGVSSTSTTVSPLLITTVSLAIVATMLAAPYAQSASPGTLAPVNAVDDAVLRGRVVDANSGRAVAGASVRAQYITGIETPPKCPIGDCENIGAPMAGRIPIYRVTADSDGRFAIRDMKPGDYLVAAAAPGYVQRFYGQTSLDMPEMSVNVSTGQRTPAINVSLERAGSISGRILSDAGAGVDGVEVELWRRTYMPGGIRPVPIAFAQTERRGTFSFRTITAGEYFVRAYAGESTRPTRAPAASYVSTFFPETADVTFAQPIVMASGQELGGIEFTLMTAMNRSVSGRLVDPAGAPITSAAVQLIARPNGAMDDMRAQAAADGRFRLPNVPPGDYMLTVIDTANTRSWNTAVRDITVVNDVSDLLLVAGPTAWVDGRIVFDDGRPMPYDPSDIQVMTEQRISTMGIHGAGFARVAADGSFSMRSGTGMLGLRVLGLRPRWFVKSIRLDGVEVSATAFELTPGPRRRVEITLSDRVSRLSGTVTDRSARPVVNALVVVFPDDRARWTDARAIKTTFSRQQGRYELEGLPVTSYRVVAVTSLPRDAWTDPEVLARLWPSGSTISLDELGQGTLHVRIVPPPNDLLQ